MKRNLSLTSRAFLFAFLPICLMLGASFITINAAIRAKIKESLKESMRRTERTLDSANADYNRRNIQMLTILSQDAGLKAGIGLLRKMPQGAAKRAQVLQTIETQLREVGGVLDYDLLILNDSKGLPLGGYVGKNLQDTPLDSISSTEDLFPFINVGGKLFEATAVPIVLGKANLGSLTLGKRFDLDSISGSGYAALVHDHKIVLTNFPADKTGHIETDLATRCNDVDNCEIEAGGEDFLTLRIRRAGWGDNVQLYTFQSIDAAMREFMGGFRRDFIAIGAGGILIVLLFSILGSHSFSKPIKDLIEHLSRSEQTGHLAANFRADSPIGEVNQLAEAFNRAANAIEESQHHLEEAELQFVETMAQALDARDPYTAGHSNRVSVNATMIAEAMGLTAHQVEVIRIGAKLHDIGKIGVPDAILQKAGDLTREELALIRLHPEIGKRILEKVARFQEYLPIVELHHEDYNGGGYPYGLKGEQIPLPVRIVHVADVYDALTSDRAYRAAMPEESAAQALREASGTMFDPAVVEAFLGVIGQRKVLQQVLEQVSVIACD